MLHFTHASYSCKCRSTRKNSKILFSEVIAHSNASNKNSSNGDLGAKVEKWLKTPFDVAAFGPRISLGALVSLPERIQNLQGDVEKAMNLLNDPRPLDVKSKAVLKEVEETVVGFLEKGAALEVGVISNIKTVLPAEAAALLNEFVPDPPVSQKPATTADPIDVQASSAINNTPSSPGEDDLEEPVVLSPSEVMLNQIQVAVSAVQDALSAMRGNADATSLAILKLNLREAKDLLARRLNEISLSTLTPTPSMNSSTVFHGHPQGSGGATPGGVGGVRGGEDSFQGSLGYGDINSDHLTNGSNQQYSAITDAAVLNAIAEARMLLDEVEIQFF